MNGSPVIFFLLQMDSFTMTATWTNDMTPSQSFWDKIAKKYAARKVGDQAAYEKTLQRVTEHLGPDDSVLELGSGTGTTALLLAGNVKSYLSTDFSPGMIAIAEEKLAAEKTAGSAPEGLSFLTADAFDGRVSPPAESPGYDVVMAFNFIHLVENQEALVARVHEMLKSGGLFITKTPCLKPKAWLYGPMIAVMRLFGKAPYVNLMSPEMVNDLYKNSGFEIVETGLYPAPHSHFVVARKV
ncbi:MAG: class I SAM-dependent methyltransferase [Roseibium sp.]